MNLLLTSQFSTLSSFSQIGSRINSISATRVSEPAAHGTNSISKTNIRQASSIEDQDKPDISKDLSKPFDPRDLQDSDK